MNAPIARIHTSHKKQPDAPTQPTSPIPLNSSNGMPLGAKHRWGTRVAWGRNPIPRKYLPLHQNDEHDVLRVDRLIQRDHDQQHERLRGDRDHNPVDGAAGGGDGNGDGVCGASGGDDERGGGGAGGERVECE